MDNFRVGYDTNAFQVIVIKPDNIFDLLGEKNTKNKFNRAVPVYLNPMQHIHLSRRLPQHSSSHDKAMAKLKDIKP
jgi:guanylate kinase